MLFLFTYLSYNGRAKGLTMPPCTFTYVIKTVSQSSVIAFGFAG